MCESTRWSHTIWQQFYSCRLVILSVSFCGIIIDNKTYVYACAGDETNLLFNVRRIVAATSTENSITAPDVMAGRTTWRPGIRDKRRTEGDIQKESSF